MLGQPVRLGGLAIAYAFATSVLLLVTFLASNLVLTVIGGIGLGADAVPKAVTDPPAAAVLLSAETDRAEDVDEQQCRNLRKTEVRGPTELLDRCDDRRARAGLGRP